MDRVFLDTNVLIYAFDRGEPVKQKRAQELLQLSLDTGCGLMSTQVLGEFMSVATTKIQDPLSVREAELEVRRFLEAWHVALVTEMVLLEAARGMKEFRFPYWDAQVWATALLNQAPLVLSEDFQDGFEAEGVRFTNPFSKGFDMESLFGSLS